MKKPPLAAPPARAGGRNSVRIIGGQWRRRLLRFPDSIGLRPTPDRVRETLFNWLGQDLTGHHCLDLFAGSGALGLEALSRGALSVTLVEQSRDVVASLRSNAEMLTMSSPRLIIHCGDALEFLSRRGQSTEPRFDIVFLDPPFAAGWIEQVMPLLAGVLNAQARVYVETQNVAALGDGWEIARAGRAGVVHYALARACPSTSAGVTEH